MGHMSSKERVLAAIARERPDRVPIDYTAVQETTDRMKRYFGVDTYEQLMQALRVDFRIVEPRFLGAEVYDATEEGYYVDMWGIAHREHITGAVKFHEFVKKPLEHVETVKEILDYPWPTADLIDVSMTKKQAESYSDYAVVSGPWTPLLCQLFFMCGMEQTLINMAERPELVRAAMDKIVQFYADSAVKIFEAGKGKIDIFYTGDDFASQRSLMVSREMFCEFFKPGFKKLFDLAKDYRLKVMMHSCGAITQIIPDFVEIGADIIDPVQVTADGMDIGYLKETYGDRVSFHGAIDQQHFLRFSSPEEVRREVRRTFEILGKGGGYLLCSSHDMLSNIPTGNIVAMYDEAAKCAY
jgi:uroporphyrinogen decarboxylase